MRLKKKKRVVFFTTKEAAKRICEATRPGRKVANVSQGALSEVFVEEKLKGKNAAELAEIVARWNGVFQQWRNVEEVVVPYVSELLEVVTAGKPLVYKGVSYNPMITAYGENVNILDFFGWLKAGGFKGIVLDASLYAIVNATKKVPVKKYTQNAAQEAAEFLLSEIEAHPEIKNAACTRGRYLRAAATSLFSPSSQPLVIDAEMMWQSDRYRSCLQKAIAFCTLNPKYGSELDIKRYANYVRYDTPYQRWYSVLVLAEALYLYEVYGANIKLGPTTESNFDSLIREFMASLGISYGFIWYDRSVEKQILYPELIFFDDEKEEIEKKLQNEKLEKWMREIIAPFSASGGDSVKQLIRVIETVRGAAARNIPKLSAEGGWFLTFPPGACD